MIVYGKTGTKSRPCAARIHIRQDGILLQIYFTKIDAHREYIENAPENIKAIFTCAFDTWVGCKACRGKCGPKEYTIDGRFFSICRDAPFFIKNPPLEKLSEYGDLFMQFYPKKKSKL